jgi:hypothetical protein
MPARSKQQQRLMGMVRAYQKGELKDAPEQVRKIAQTMKEKDTKKFAATKHKGLPEKVTETVSFKTFLKRFKNTYEVGDTVNTPFGKGKIVSHKDEGSKSEHFMVEVGEEGRKKHKLENKPYKMTSFDFSK